MKTVVIPVIDDDDRAEVREMSKIGLRPHVSMTIIYLATMGKSTTEDIVNGTPISWGYVMSALAWLRDHEWVCSTKRKLSRGEKWNGCRPTVYHELVRDKEYIVKWMITEQEITA